ncbi:MAG: ABC transporter permease, partial [Candidatus Acidiferrales bacterium]
MGIFWQDFRYGIRKLVKSPGFTFFAVMALALGIAANTAIFSLADAVLFRPLPYRDPGRLVMVWEDSSFIGFPENTPAPGNFRDWSAQNHSFEQMAAYRRSSLNLTGDGQPERLIAGRVTANLFSILDVEPAMGRMFLPEDDQPGAARVALLSHGLWLRRFGSDASILGKTIRLNDQSFTVIGVMPRGKQFPDKQTDFWVPMQLTAGELGWHDSHYLHVIARLKPGVTLTQANADLASIAARLARQYPESNTNVGAYAVPLHKQVTGDLRDAIFILLAAVGFVLLIACANVANLQLARAAGCEREMAVRLAMGASRGRLVRQLLTESLQLAGLAGGVGLLLSQWGMAFLVQLIPAGFPGAARVGLNSKVLIFTMLVCVATGVLFGLAPAFRVRALRLNESLKQGGRTGAGPAGAKTRDALVVAEVALALVLLAGAGLMIESFANLHGVDPGFRADHVLAMRTPLPVPRYAELSKRNAFYDRVLERVSRIPGVTSAAYATWLPLTNRGGTRGFLIEGRPAPKPGEVSDANIRMVSADYARTLGMQLKAGRWLSESDGAESQFVAVINEAMARQFFPNQNSLGERIKFGALESKDPWITIVGIVGDVRQMGLDVPGRAEMYMPYRQQQQAYFSPEYLAVKTSGEPLPFANAVREQVWAVDPEQPVAGVMAMQ